MTYEYRCDPCKKEYELDQKITEDPQKTCIFCGQQTAKRLISNPNFILKGSGWFKDGY